MSHPSSNPGSYIQAAQKSFSLVRGGRAREAAALAWERQGPAPSRSSYNTWAKSVIDNPALVETKVKSSTAQMKSFESTRKADVVYVFDPGALHHRPGSGDPVRRHKEAAPKEGPAAVLG